MSNLPLDLSLRQRRAFDRALLLAAFLRLHGHDDFGPAAIPILRHLDSTRKGKLYQRDKKLSKLRNMAVHAWLSEERFDELVQRAGVVLVALRQDE